jgi:hypothetical protein
MKNDKMIGEIVEFEGEPRLSYPSSGLDPVPCYVIASKKYGLNPRYDEDDYAENEPDYAY